VSTLLKDNVSINVRSRRKEEMVARRVIHRPGGRSAMRLSIQHPTAIREAFAMPSRALSDDQMNIITKLAEPLLHIDRGPYLQRVAQLLSGQPEIGDGVVHRAAEQAQREFRRSVTLEDRGHAGKYAQSRTAPRVARGKKRNIGPMFLLPARCPQPGERAEREVGLLMGAARGAAAQDRFMPAHRGPLLPA
jgi:hypothetical protein